MCPIKILIADDSAFMRLTLSRRLAAEPDFQVVGTASDGPQALAQLHALKPDVITLDVEMPGLDGLHVLTRIMAERPTPVIMVSSLTQAGAEVTVRALTLGAYDFVPKPSGAAGTQAMTHELAIRIRQATAARLRRPAAEERAQIHARAKPELRPFGPADTLLVIGSSTGGPAALRYLFAGLPTAPGVAAVVVQHMPAGFTRSLAERLNDNSAWCVREAAAGDRLLCGQALVAPGGYHLIDDGKGGVTLSQDPPVNNVRPSVDVTMCSLAQAYGRRIVGLILTGMGRDGTAGALRIKDAGGRVIAEAESSCVVYGMPRSVVEAGAADHVAALPDLPALTHRSLVGGGR